MGKKLKQEVKTEGEKGQRRVAFLFLSLSFPFSFWVCVHLRQVWYPKASIFISLYFIYYCMYVTMWLPLSFSSRWLQKTTYREEHPQKEKEKETTDDNRERKRAKGIEWEAATVTVILQPFTRENDVWDLCILSYPATLTGTTSHITYI